MATRKIQLNRFLTQFSRKKILVLGDMMLDHYIWGSVRRISPEAPVPVVNVQSESVLLGGAGNVLQNILTLGGDGMICSVVGSDDAGKWIRDEIFSKGVPLEGLVVEDDRPTTKKTRIIAHQQQVVRYDHEERAQIKLKTERKMAAFIADHLMEIDGIVVSDYAKGVVTERLMKKVISWAKKRGIPVVVDPKVDRLSYYKNVTMITPNHLEASEGSGIEIVDEKSLCTAGKKLLKNLKCEAVLITRGEQGMSLFEKNGKVTHIPTEAKEVYDVTGAGDTVVGTLSLALAAGASFAAAARMANHAAGIVVGEVGTAAIHRNKLEQVLS
ncbi:MAG TPA: D-glycero-beta-D-manno-heptose-7-phosphate kinase [Nitrospiria bacterium]|nr:D-glycero-beta-D-manno-heptose-7-phosphate kinase [Candidatus Manganitrophaceae bacterium]HIL34644.1 D-glycero-beta-D-manno-heptose-7-phosphate kinase [Candidatus Manganitrophaceae bacterium]